MVDASDVGATWSGTCGELDPVEVVARPVPPYTAEGTLPSPEAQMLADAGVTVCRRSRRSSRQRLALIVSRDVTTRDRIDRQQPFNLQVTGTSHATLGAGGKVYDVSYLQIAGRHDPRHRHEPRHATPGSPRAGTLSTTLPSIIRRRATPTRPRAAWRSPMTGRSLLPCPRAGPSRGSSSTTRARRWCKSATATFQPGEVRVCTSCHGLNQVDQAGAPAPTNAPKVLLTLFSKNSKTQGKL
ncbi:MAG: hypothetical protein R3E85_07635 [Planctomycetota bacterium]